MRYRVEIKPKAINDMKPFPGKDKDRILSATEDLEDDLTGDVRRLTDFFAQYRLRVGDYRVLFNVEGEKAVVYRVRLRKDAYR